MLIAMIMTFYLIMYLGGRYGSGGQLSSFGVLDHFILFTRLNNIHGLFSDFYYTSIATNISTNIQTKYTENVRIYQQYETLRFYII